MRHAGANSPGAYIMAAVIMGRLDLPPNAVPKWTDAAANRRKGKNYVLRTRLFERITGGYHFLRLCRSDVGRVCPSHDPVIEAVPPRLKQGSENCRALKASVGRRRRRAVRSLVWARYSQGCRFSCRRRTA